MASAHRHINPARLAAAALAGLWAMLGLGNAYAVWAAQGSTPPIVAAIALDILLIAAAALAFCQAAGWRAILSVALLTVTADRIYNAISGGGGAITIISALIALVAIATLTAISGNAQGGA